MRAEALAADSCQRACDGEADRDYRSDQHAQRDQLVNAAERTIAHCSHNLAGNSRRSDPGRAISSGS